MIHELSVKILGSLPDYAVWCYSCLDLILGVILVALLISPFVLLIKILGGK